MFVSTSGLTLYHEPVGYWWRGSGLAACLLGWFVSVHLVHIYWD